MTMSNDTTRDDHGRNNALAGYDNLRDMVAALECDYDRLDELRAERDALDIDERIEALEHVPGRTRSEEDLRELVELDTIKTNKKRVADWRASRFAAVSPDEAAELAELEEAAGECASRDDAEQRVHEDALVVCVRSDWHPPSNMHGAGENGDAPTEFYILLSTGGPALRIRGELDRGEPSRAWLEYQDWGTPWTQLIHDARGEPVDSDVLLAYARCFYFGEG